MKVLLACLVPMLLAPAACSAPPVGGSAAGSLGFAEYDSVHVGMRAGDFERRRPTAVPEGYGWYSDSIPGFRVGLEFAGTTASEGQSPPARSPLRYVQFTPRDETISVSTLMQRVGSALDSEPECFLLTEDARGFHFGGYARWESPIVHVADLTSRPSFGGGRRGDPVRRRSVFIGGFYLQRVDVYPTQQIGCDEFAEGAWAEDELPDTGSAGILPN